MMRIPSNIKSDAWIEDNYRYSLTREWEANAPRLVVIMLNPSTADAKKNDPTLLRCIHFAHAWQFGSLEVVNPFAWRSPSPSALLEAQDPVGPKCDIAIALALGRSTGFAIADGGQRRRFPDVLVAWGHPPSEKLYERVWAVEHLISNTSKLTPKLAVCLGRTKHGWPKHPLARGAHRVPDDQQPIPYTTERA